MVYSAILIKGGETQAGTYILRIRLHEKKSLLVDSKNKN
jgi:hypothetical protein